MAAGRTTFIDDILIRNGFVNVLNDSRYPELTQEQMLQLDPDLVLLSSEPYPFAEKHKEELETLFRSSQILLVDGEMFSWYGTRLRLACDYFASLPV